MPGADIVYYASSTGRLVDAHVLDRYQDGPIVDKCQNWKLRAAQSTDGFVIFEAFRSLNTADPQDRSIINDGDPGNVPAHRIIAAWGDTQQISYHGKTNRIRSAIRFYGNSTGLDSFSQTMKKQAQGSFVVRAYNYQIKQQETEYKYFCFSKNDLITLGAPSNRAIQIIGWEPIISKLSQPYVHHFIIYGSQRLSIESTGGDCQQSDVFQVAYGWAPGEDPFALPANVGAPYMSSEGFNSLQLEVHYNNPSLVKGIVDNSGVRLYYTTQLRDNYLFVYQYGDPRVHLRHERVGDNSNRPFYQHTFSCPNQCSRLALPGPTTVVREYLHMHKTGARFHNAQIRNGKIIRSGVADFWDFAQQGSFAVIQRPFQVLPGDTFQTKCFYKPVDNASFGLSSQEEMCMAFLYFYRPSSYGFPSWIECSYGADFAPCAENHTKQALSLTSQLGRIFGTPSKHCHVNASGKLSAASSSPDVTGALPASSANPVPTGAVPTASATDNGLTWTLPPSGQSTSEAPKKVMSRSLGLSIFAILLLSLMI